MHHAILNKKSTRIALLCIAAAALSACTPKEESAPVAAAPAPVEALLPQAAPAAAVMSPALSVLTLATQPADATSPNNGWARVAQVREVTWKWGADKVEANDYTMRGVLTKDSHKIADLADINVSVIGARTMYSNVVLEVFDPAGTPLMPEDLGVGEMIRIETDCDDDSASNTFKFHVIERPGYKPFYVSYQIASGSGGTTSTWTAADSQDMLMRDAGGPGVDCKVSTGAGVAPLSTASKEPAAMPAIPPGSVDRVRDLNAALTAGQPTPPITPSPAAAVASKAPAAPAPAVVATYVDGKGVPGEIFDVKKGRMVIHCTHPVAAYELAVNLAQAAASSPQVLGAMMTNTTYARSCQMGDEPADVRVMKLMTQVASAPNVGYFALKHENAALVMLAPKR